MNAGGQFVESNSAFTTHYQASITQVGSVQINALLDDLPLIADDPATWAIPSPVFTVWDFYISDGAAGWVPGVMINSNNGAFVSPSSRTFQASIRPASDHNGKSLLGMITFSLNSSSEPGFCMNRGDELPPNFAWDLQFPVQDGYNVAVNGLSATTNGLVLDATVVVYNYDFGTHGTISASADIPAVPLGGTARRISTYPPTAKYYAGLPVDEDSNAIADPYAYNAGGALDDNENVPNGDGTPGDGFTRYEEYRGFIKQDTSTQLYVYVSPNPINTKDVFVMNTSPSNFVSATGAFPANSGLTTHVLFSGGFDADHTINLNRSAGLSLGAQHGVALVKAPAISGNFLYGECTAANATPPWLNQAQVTAWIDLDKIRRDVPADKYAGVRDWVMAHELGHGVTCSTMETTLLMIASCGGLPIGQTGWRFRTPSAEQIQTTSDRFDCTD